MPSKICCIRAIHQIALMISVAIVLSGSVPCWAQQPPPISDEPSLVPYCWHVGGADCIAYSPDGATIATAGYPGVRLWEAKTGAYIRDLSRDDGPLLAYSPDGTSIAATGEQTPAQVKLLDAHTGAVKWAINTSEWTPELNGREPDIYCLLFSPDGKMLVTVTDGEVRFWDARTGRRLALHIKTNRRIGSIAFAPNGKTFALGEGGLSPNRWPGQAAVRRDLPLLALGTLQNIYQNGSRCGVGAWEGEGCAVASRCQLAMDSSALELYDARSGRLLRKIATVTGNISDLHFLSDGANLAYITSIGGGMTTTGQEQMGFTDLEVRDVRSGRLRWCETDCIGVAVSPHDDTVMEIRGRYPFGRLRDGRTGRVQRVIFSTDGTSTATFSPDGETLATGGGIQTALHITFIGLRLWDVDTGRIKANVSVLGGTGKTWHALASDGKRLLGENSEGRIDTWSLQTGALHCLQTDQVYVNHALFSSDGKTVLEDAVAVRRSSNPISNPTIGHHTLRLRDCWTGRVRKSFRVDQERLTALAWSPDESLIAAVQSAPPSAPDPGIWVWDAQRALRLFHLTPSFSGGIDKILFNRDGRRLVSTSSHYDPYRAVSDVWDLQTHRLLCTLPVGQKGEIYRKNEEGMIGFTSDDQIVSLENRDQSRPNTRERDRRVLIRFRDPNTGKLVHEWSVPSPPGASPTARPERCLLSPDGKMLLLPSEERGDYESTVTFYDCPTGKIVRTTRVPITDDNLFWGSSRIIAPTNFFVWIGEIEHDSELVRLCPLPLVGSWMVSTPNSDYDCSPDAFPYLTWLRNNLFYSSDELAERHYRPGLMQSLELFER